MAVDGASVSNILGIEKMICGGLTAFKTQTRTEPSLGAVLAAGGRYPSDDATEPSITMVNTVGNESILLRKL